MYLRPSERSTVIPTHPKRGRRLHHHVKAAVDGADIFTLPIPMESLRAMQAERANCVLKKVKQCFCFFWS